MRSIVFTREWLVRLALVFGLAFGLSACGGGGGGDDSPNTPTNPDPTPTDPDNPDEGENPDNPDEGENPDNPDEGENPETPPEEEPTDPTIELAIDKTKIAFDFAQGTGDTVDPVVVTIKMTPSSKDLPVPDNVHVIALQSGTNTLNADLGYEQDDNLIRFHLKPNNALAAGTHTGTLRITLCEDAACEKPLTVDGPLEVKVTVDVT